MRPRLHRRSRGVALVAALSLSVSATPPALAESIRTLAPLRELQGIGAVGVALDGMPGPLGKSAVTEATLRASVLARLKNGSVPVALDTLSDAPVLHLTVLPVLHGSIYYVTIHARLEERCSVPRNPALHIYPCATWWAFPTIGIVAVGDETRVEQLLLGTVDQFARSYEFDNRRGAKSEQTSN